MGECPVGFPSIDRPDHRGDAGLDGLPPREDRSDVQLHREFKGVWTLSVRRPAAGPASLIIGEDIMLNSAVDRRRAWKEGISPVRLRSYCAAEGLLDCWCGNG